MKFNLFLFIFITIFFTIFASAEIQTLGTLKQDSDVTLIQSCDNCTFVNISSVSYPNTSVIISNVAMTKTLNVFSYTLSGNYTDTLGRYIVCGFGDENGVSSSFCYDFFINTTGRQEPSGAVIVLFFVMFFAIMGFLVFFLISSLGRFVELSFDYIDVGFNWGVYFALISFWLLQDQYLGNPLLSTMSKVLVSVGGITSLFLPIIFLFLSEFRKNTAEKRITGGDKW